MSEFHIEVVRLRDVKKHPNADTLSMAYVRGQYPVIFQTSQFTEGDLAIYIPVDAVIHPSVPGTEFLGESRRIRAKKLRGIFSMGLLMPISLIDTLNPFEMIDIWGDPEGLNVAEFMHGITKYEPPEPAEAGGENEAEPGFFFRYTDIEGLRAFPDLLRDGEEVVVTEKIHGANCRFLWQDDRLWVGSHVAAKKPNPDNMIWKLAKDCGLEEKLKAHSGHIVFGEVIGAQDLKYGTQKGEKKLAIFDVARTVDQMYLDHDDFLAFAKEIDVPVVPQLYRGPWSKDLWRFAEGKSKLADHVREGFVVKPTKERMELEKLGGRVILKLIGESYHLRK